MNEVESYSETKANESAARVAAWAVRGAQDMVTSGIAELLAQPGCTYLTAVTPQGVAHHATPSLTGKRRTPCYLQKKQ
ncbi:hypothetical protein HaLaN_02647 [Haematococcus lacustris]|uniref:Uncharacterized protein n=1 Tax=Haematococcus lacustris TaxID=44745 RepID=A0A699YCP4_HAELA|nr:hypothetical protein HaLaN_02647 [Haematococcus lacustris]